MIPLGILRELFNHNHWARDRQQACASAGSGTVYCVRWEAASPRCIVGVGNRQARTLSCIS
jgi:hypothetical protein